MTTDGAVPNPTSLTLDQLVKIIADAKAASGNPLSAAMRVLGALGGAAIVSGDLLRQALNHSDVPLGGPLSSSLDRIQSVSKIGNEIKISSTEATELLIEDTLLRLLPEVTFVVTTDQTPPACTDIKGIAVHKFVWLDIQTVQVKTIAQQTVLHVVTPAGSRDIALR